MAVWTIEVGTSQIARDYKTIDFDRKLKTKSPTTFSALIKYYGDIDYFDIVQIKRDGIVEWRGFIESIIPEWDEDGRYLRISGRDTRVILWKKYSENFSNMHEGTAGFFGKVSANELMKFLLRVPRSDSVHEYPDSKSGWGISQSRIGDIKAGRTSIGDPNWTKLRRRGFGWRNTGSPHNSEEADVDAVVSNAWSTAGVSPYLDAEDDANYIYSKTVDQEASFSFENLSTLDANASGINTAYLTVVWKPDQTWFWWIQSHTEVWLSPDGGSNYYLVGHFTGREAPFKQNPWRTFTWKVTDIIDTVTKADNARIKFINKSSDLYTYITHAYLGFSYETDGEQDLEDVFDIPFDEETIMGIYVESRMDNDSYPRNYKVCTVSDDLQDFDTEYAPNEVDPNNHIAYPSDYHIDFDAYNDEIAYTYDDFGTGYFAEYFRHFFDVKIITDPIPDPAGGLGIMAGVYCLTNALGDILAVELTGTYVTICVFRDPADVIAGGAPCFRAMANGSGFYTPEIDEGKTYRIVVERVGDEITFTFYEDGTYFWKGTIAGLGATAYRYLCPAVTANDSEVTHTDVDIDNLYLETETDLATVTGNTYRDILHSWRPQTLNNIRIRITSQDTSHSWAISQVYIYKADECDYRCWIETGCTPTYHTNNYIASTSFDSTYSNPIGPLNLPKERLIDVLNTVIEKCHAAYIPYEWWIAYDVANTFHFKNRKGSDLSGSVSFIKGTNLGKAKRTKSIEDTVQRVQIIGRGKGKRSEEVSSGWVEDTTAMGNVNTFYEDVISRKTEVDKDEADVLAQIFLESEGEPKDQLVVDVSNDTYATNEYDVGDDVTITDSLTGASGSYRIYDIKKKIDADGEHVTIIVGYPWQDDVDTWADIFRRLKEIELTESLVADWMGEGVDENKISSKDATTASFEKTAKNDIEDPVKRELKDADWYISPNPSSYNDATGYPARTPAKANSANGRTFVKTDKWLEMLGPDGNVGTLTYTVELRGDSSDADAVGAGEFEIAMSKNPKFVCEMKCYEPAGGSPTAWNEDDFFDVGIFNGVTSKGFYFRIKRLAAGGFQVYARWDITGSDLNDNEYEMRQIEKNKRYRFEIVTLSDERLVIFNIYDLEIDEKYPLSAIAMEIDTSVIVRPLYMHMSADDENNVNLRAIVYLYRLRTEWEKV